MNAHEKERNEVLSKIDEEKIKALKEQPVEKDMDSTEMIALWHEKKEILKEKDFRDDPWRLAREAFFMGMSCGFGYCKAQLVCEGEEEEYEQIKQKVCSDCPSHKDDYCGYVKRQLQRKCNYLSDVMYGYELGRQSKPKVCEGLEKEIGHYLSDRWKFGCVTPITPVILPNFTTEDLKECARHFAKWQKEQMMKEAVEGIVTTRSMAGNIVTAHIDHQFKDGQKVKIIIVKED